MKKSILTFVNQFFTVAIAIAATVFFTSCNIVGPKPDDDPTQKDTIPQGTPGAVTAQIPVYNNWVFEDVKPEIQVAFTNPEDSVQHVKMTWLVKTDTKHTIWATDTIFAVKGGKSKQLVPLPVNEPGIYQIYIRLNGQTIRLFHIAVDPTKIVSAPDMQPDFEEFWAKTKAELAAIDPEYKLTELPDKSSNARKVYLLEYRSLKDMGDTAAIARAYWCEPTDGKRHKVLIHYQGYDSGGYAPWCPNGDDNKNACELVLATRGQLMNNRAPFTNNYGDWFGYGFVSKEDWYYRGAFCDAIRAIDFVYTREASDTLNVFAEGSSQGGALSYAAAALGNHPLNAIAPCVPFLGDFPDYFQIVGWPANTAMEAKAANNWTDEQLYTMLSYFDTKNLATLVKCPVIETIGLQDQTCPPHTNLAPYNNLPAGVDKEISYNPEMQHAIPPTWTITYNAFFERYMVK